jgi:hypothetical protein
VVPVAPPVPVVPEGPTVVEPLLPEVPPDGAPDMPEPVVEPPDMAPLPEPVLPVDGEAVVAGVVLVVVDAPGEVVSAARRSQPAASAVSAKAASVRLASLDTDCMEISFDLAACLLNSQLCH